MTEKRVVRPAPWIRDRVGQVMTAAGTPDAAADHFADHMTEAHLRGVDTHGLRRVGPYLDRIVQGGVDAAAEPSFTGRGALIQVDGLNGLGHHVAAEAADAASRAAKELGVGAAWVRGGNHFGFAGYYAVRMAARGQVGLVGSNGQVCVGPAGSTRALLSNDPLALAAPIDQDDFIELDMAASVTSRANIVQAAREGKALPEGWAQDDRGRPTTDPEAALAGSLLAFGGHKGWALLFALEVLIGVLDGGAYADQVVSKEEHPNAPENLSQFFLAIDLDQLQGRSDFQARLGDLIDRMNQLPLAPDADPPRYPGRTRWNLRRRRLREGVPIQPRDYQSFYEAGQRFGIRID